MSTKTAPSFAFASITLIGALLGGCGERIGIQNSALDSFVANTDGNAAKNVMAAFLGNSDGIPGTRKDIPSMNREMTGANGIKFEMPGPSTGGWVDATTEQIISQTASIARDMLESDMKAWKNLQPGGTLFLYITSHGTADGKTITADGSVTLPQIAAKIREARGGHPLERLIIFLDICYAGSQTQAVTQATGGAGGLALAGETLPAGTTDASRLEALVSASVSSLTTMTGLYKSLISIGASSPQLPSGDESDGGTGTLAFLGAVKSAYRAAPSAVVQAPAATNNAPAANNNQANANAGGNGPTSNGPSNSNGLQNSQNFPAAQPQEMMGGEDDYYLADNTTTSSQPQPVASAPVAAPTAASSSTATIDQVLRDMQKRAGEQTPVYCLEPQELKDDFFFAPPAGFLPVLAPNAAEPGKAQRYCNNGRN